MGKEKQPIQNGDGNPVYLTVTDNVAKVDRERATPADLLDLVDQCSKATELWFNFTYNLFGEHKTIRARDFIRTRTMDEKERTEFIKQATRELVWAENIEIAILNPDKPDFGNKY